MSTNFYWKLPVATEVVLPNDNRYHIDATSDDPELHIGKGFMGGFSWAQDPKFVREVCAKNADKVVIISEYHQGFTGRAFLDWIADVKDHRTDHVGEWFN